MWNSLGSFRERVREHAKSAAQVAQGVLQAAAAEEDYPPEPAPDNQQDNAGDWGWGAPDRAPNNTPFDNSTAPQPYPGRLPPEDSVPPPPEDSFVSAMPPVVNSAPRSRRASRYLVTGVATAQPQGAAPAVPKPSFFAPKPPVIASQPADDTADVGIDKSDDASGVQADASTHSPAHEEPPADVATNSYSAPDHSDAVGHSTAPQNATMPEAPGFPANVAEPPKAEEGMFGEEATGVPPAEVSIADWRLTAEEQNSQSTTAPPADDSFPSWGVDVSATEQRQPENVPPPPADDTFPGWGVDLSATEEQQPESVPQPPADDSIAPWNVPQTTMEQQEPESVPPLPADENAAPWNVPETTMEQQQDQESEATPVDDSFNGWGVPSASVQTPAEQQNLNSIADPANDMMAGWSVPETSMEPQRTQRPAETPAEDSSAGWDLPETAREPQRGQTTEAPPPENSFAGWNVPDATMEAQKSQGTEGKPAADNFASWSVPETAAGEQKSQSAATAATENTFADWSVPDASAGEQQNEQNGWDIPSSAVNPNETAHGDEARKDDAFADWGEADGEWNLDGDTSAMQDAVNGVAWFSSGAASSDVQDKPGGATKEAVTTNEESTKEAQTPDAPEAQTDSGPLMPPQLSTPTLSDEPTSANGMNEENDMPCAPAAQPDTENTADTDDAEKEGTENIKLENSSMIPDVALHQENNGWSFNATVTAAGNGIDATSLSNEEGGWNLQPATPVINSQEPVPHNPIISSGPVPSAESWFADHGAQETEEDSRDPVPQGEVQHEPALYEPRSTPRPEQEAFESQSSEMALQIDELQQQLRSVMLERDSAIAAKETSERESNDLKRSIALTEANLAQSREESGYLAAQRDVLQKEIDAALEHKLEVEKERDEAIQRGGDGLREARNAIEVMRSNQDSTEKREAAITEQIDSLRTDLDLISKERNTLLGEAEDLRVSLREMESQSRQKEDELRQRLQIAEHESEIARLEREKALETNELHMDENRRLTDAEKGRAAALAESDGRVVELENYIGSMQTDRDDENVRIELLSKQIEEMKDRTQGVIDERNGLYDEKRNLENEIEEYKQREEAYTRQLQDAKRDAASVGSERDEAKQRFMSMKDQQKELTARVEALAAERDQLVQARTAATASSSSVSEKEKALAMECEQKTRVVAILQKKLTSAISKIEKVTAQRSTFQRQRDEAGARLRAAGAEFAALNSKLEELSIAKNTVQNQLVQIRDERDTALSRVEETIALESQLQFAQDTLASKNKEVEDLQSKLKESKQEVATMQESNAAAQQRATSLATEVSELQGRLEVVSREKDLINRQKDDLEQEKSALQTKVSERESCEKQLSKQLKSMEAEYTTLKEKSAMDLGIAKAELASEQQLHQDSKIKMSDLQNEMSQHSSGVDQIRSTIASCVEAIRSDIVQGSETISSAEWHGIDNSLNSKEALTCVSAAKLVSRYSEVTTQIIRNSMSVAQDYRTLQEKYDDSAKLLGTLEQYKAELLVSASEIETLTAEIGQAKRDLEGIYVEKAGMETAVGNLQEQLTIAADQRAEVEARLEVMTHEMQEEMQRRIQLSAEEREGLIQEAERVTTNINSIWSMLRKSLGQEQLEILTDEASQYSEPDADENVAVLALRATASIVAELSRNRSQIEDIESKLKTAEAEATRLIDRAEIAEQERDTAKGTKERLERKLKVSHSEGKEEAKAHYEGIVGQLEDELDDTRQELARTSDKANRSEKEASELRALCNKLTSQFNGRTNELDEAEEKVVYLQDQVTTLEEDLEEAHARLKKLEEESTEARQSDVKRLTEKLEETTAQLEDIEKECTRLREAYDEADNVAKESRLLADTHKQAEDNLQIAIEQLEAAQESAVEQRTIELQKKLEDAEQRCTAATEREAASSVTQRQLAIRDEEIKELRGAIGRLADERVELKLELEKSLSRLNHPDAGGQLVDRRVVRQLLVSYFRVGSVRRRDVLELMSRMLAFSDSDNIAVGLKRRALIDRLGSLVQAPELDDASLPPLGTVSDKWIEFLMKETEEGEEQAKGW